MDKEIWKDIKGYEGLYQISNLGRVKSLKRKVYAGKGKMRWEDGGILSTYRNNGNGYKIVGLNRDNKVKNKYIHRLVAEMFIENPNNYKYVNHKDEDKSNNNINNLEWCTAQYNSTYNNLHIKKGLKLRNNLTTSKKVYQLDENENIIKEYPSISEASRILKVSYQAISDCLRGIQKHSAGYKWKYANDKDTRVDKINECDII